MDWASELRRIKRRLLTTGPATEAELAQCMTSIGVSWPETLRTLLLHSNGIEGETGERLVWSAEEIVQQNTTFRALDDFRDLYMPFESLLFFGDDGGGDQFAFRILRGGIPNAEVYRWDHENDSRTWIASDLLRFLSARPLRR